MGENEQGGMLRMVIVIGLVSLIAAVVTLGVVGLKGSMNHNSTKAVGAVETATKPYGNADIHRTFEDVGPLDQSKSVFGTHAMFFPYAGDVPDNSWREVRINVRSDKRIWFNLDINNNGEKVARNANDTINNDNDVIASRSMKLYKTGDDKVIDSTSGTTLVRKVYLEPNTDYTIDVKYFNKSGAKFIDTPDNYSNTYDSVLFTGTDDGSQYTIVMKSFEAATYDDKYND